MPLPALTFDRTLVPLPALTFDRTLVPLPALTFDRPLIPLPVLPVLEREALDRDATRELTLELVAKWFAASPCASPPKPLFQAAPVLSRPNCAPA